MYVIKTYTRRKARTLRVKVEPSTRKNKKVKVTTREGKVFHIGHTDYTDYASLLAAAGRSVGKRNLAEARRRKYRSRHRKSSTRPNTAGYYAYNLLW